jgi:hypothetical protein
MTPLASDLLIRFREQMRREGHLKYASLPDRLSSSSRSMILGTTLRSCREVIAVPVDKIALRGKEVTESAVWRNWMASAEHSEARFRALSERFKISSLLALAN